VKGGYRFYGTAAPVFREKTGGKPSKNRKISFFIPNFRALALFSKKG
jgi:hypothetical protein